MLARAALVSILVVAVWAAALEARSSGASQPGRAECVRVQLPPGFRVPLGARLHVVGRCEMELRRLIGREGGVERARRRCYGTKSSRCATDPVNAS